MTEALSTISVTEMKEQVCLILNKYTIFIEICYFLICYPRLYRFNFSAFNAFKRCVITNSSLYDDRGV